MTHRLALLAALLFALAWFGFWLLIMLPGQFLIVKLASVIDPADKVAIGSFLIFEMAAIIVVGVPVIGWLCDRTRTRFGRRRTWALAGVIVATVPFAFVGQQSTWQGAAVLLGIVALGESALLVSLWARWRGIPMTLGNGTAVQSVLADC